MVGRNGWLRRYGRCVVGPVRSEERGYRSRFPCMSDVMITSTLSLHSGHVTTASCTVAFLLALGVVSCSDQPAATPLPRPDLAPSKLLSFSGTLQPKGMDSH